LEAKKIGGNYYLYQSTTIWDKAEKKRRKVSQYLGKITPDGVVEKRDRQRGVRSVFEYGNARALWRLADEISPTLRKWFPQDYLEILAIGIVRLLQPTPLRLMKSRWEKLYLSRKYKASLSPNTLTEKLRRVGSDWASQKGFYEELLKDTRTLVFDLSCIFSHSENLRLAEKGYNTRHLYLKQVNFALFFSLDKKVPVMLKPIPGSVRDIKSLKTTIREYDLSSYIIVLDRGMASYPLADLMDEEEMKFILPLRRNFEIIDYYLPLRGSFAYRGRGINWGKKGWRERPSTSSRM
jgi:transposase